MSGRRGVSLAAALAALILPAVAPWAAAASQTERPGGPPNILLFLVDDLGWADLPAYGNRFNETPQIDRLAAQGMLFTSAYAAGPVCSPTRASILSGQYQARFGLTAHIPGHWRPFARLAEPANAEAMPLEVVTPAEALKQAGYTSGYFGKWHLGPRSHYPDRQGFDRWVVTSGRHFAPHFRTEPEMAVAPGTALTDFLTDQAVSFMEANRERPFFLQVSHYAVHIPLESKPGLRQRYQLKPPMPGYLNNPDYAAMLEDVDHSLGRLMSALDRLNLANRTLVVFFSDNGGLHKTFTGAGEAATTNRPLRDEKGSLYEGGIRVPLIIRWPGVVEPATRSDVPVVSLDFYPTFLEAAGMTGPSPLDGESLLPLLAESGSLGRESIYFHYPHYHHSRPSGALRQGRYKLIEFFDTGHLELYDLETDLGENKNLAESLPGKAAEMRERLSQWRHSVQARMPEPNPKHDPARENEWWNRSTGRPVP